MNVKPSIPGASVDASRVAVTSTVGLPLLSSTKLWGCGLPPKLSLLHFVSFAVNGTQEHCGKSSRYFFPSPWQKSSVQRPVFSRATTLTTFLMVSVDTDVE